MQVESLPAPVPLSNISQPLPPPPASTPLPSVESADPPSVLVPLPSEECEQPTFHVMQPPPPPPPAISVSIAPVEPTAVPPSTGTFTQLVAVPITTETPIALNPTVTPAPTVKPTKRVCTSFYSRHFNDTILC